MKPEELTVAFVEDGKEKVRELDKRVLAHSSSWATVVYLFCEIDADSGEPKPPKLGLRRYKKRGGRFVLDKHFVLASGAQARGLAEAIEAWFPAGAPHAAGDEADDD
jgi:hypothetical protein